MTDSDKYIKQAFVLVGGKGERCLPLTLETPKPLIPLNKRGNINCLGLILKALTAAGFERIVVNAFYLKEQIIDYVRKNYPHVIVSVEPVPLETGGALFQALPFFDQQSPLFVMNGDTHIYNFPTIIRNMYDSFNTLNFQYDQQHILLAISLLDEEKDIGSAKTMLGDFYCSPVNFQLTHRSSLLSFDKKDAPFLFIGPRLLGTKYLNASFLSSFQKEGPKFSQRELFFYAEKQEALFGYITDEPWIGITTPQDVASLRDFIQG